MSNIINFPNKPITVRTDALQIYHPVNGIAELYPGGRFVQKRKLLNIIHCFLNTHDPFNDTDIERELVIIEDGAPAYVTTIVQLNNGKIGHLDENKVYHVSEWPFDAQIILNAIQNCY